MAESFGSDISKGSFGTSFFALKIFKLALAPASSAGEMWSWRVGNAGARVGMAPRRPLGVVLAPRAKVAIGLAETGVVLACSAL
jgi:hypothetical protein